MAARLRRVAPDLGGRRQQVDRAGGRLATAMRARLRDLDARLQQSGAAVRLLDPHAVLDRGYSIVRDAGGMVVRCASTLTTGQRVEITLAAGSASATVGTVRGTD